MPNKRTKEEFEQLMREKFSDSIIILDEYRGANTEMEFECKKGHHTWKQIPYNILKGKGCPKCRRIAEGKRRRKTQVDFLKDMAEKAPNVEALSEYKSAFEKVKFKCKKCGNIWMAPHCNVANGHTGCPSCGNQKISEKLSKSNDQFLEELAKTNPTLEPLEPYTANYVKILVRCKVHNYEWRVRPSQLLDRKIGCPKCVSSYNENKLYSILTKWGYDVVLQKRFKDCKDRHTLPFDAYLPEYNICIEYDGEQHYMENQFKWREDDNVRNSHFKIIQLHDFIKTKYCLEHEIPLIRIPYWESENMESFLFDEMVRYGAIEVVKTA